MSTASFIFSACTWWLHEFGSVGCSILMIAECHGNHAQGKLAIPQDYLELFDDAGLLSEARKSLLGFVSRAAKEGDNA